MIEETAVMVTASSPWPDNLDTASQLVIQSPCSVPDAYQLICDRKNIKKLNVAGREYTSQEVRCMSFTERLGEGGGAVLADGLINDITVPAPGWPAPPNEDPVRAIEGVWAQVQRAQTTAELDIPALIQNAYNITRARIETPTPAQLGQIFYNDPINPLWDTYYPPF